MPLLIPCHCCQGCCTHRLYDGTPEIVWSENIHPQQSCTAWVADIWSDDGDAYVVGSYPAGSERLIVVQRWAAAGTLTWSRTFTVTAALWEPLLPREQGLSITADGTHVWVAVYIEAETEESNLWKFDADDGDPVWDVQTGTSIRDIVHDGGSVFAAVHHDGAGYVAKYDADGDEIQRFGGQSPFAAFKLALGGGKLYVGSPVWQPECWAAGFVAQYNPGTEELEWLWFPNMLIEAEPIEGSPSAGAWCGPANDTFKLNALDYADGALYVGFYGNVLTVPGFTPSPGGIPLQMVVQKWDPSGPSVTWGRVLTREAVPFADRTKEFIYAVTSDGSHVWTAAGPRLWKHDVSGTLVACSEHGKKGQTPGGRGQYKAAFADGSGGVYAGGSSASCAAEDTTESCAGAAHDCSETDGECADGCAPQCGRFGPYGGVIGPDPGGGLCDITNGVPCEVPFQPSGTGCFADWSESDPITMTLQPNGPRSETGGWTGSWSGTCGPIFLRVWMNCSGTGDVWRGRITFGNGVTRDVEVLDVWCSGGDALGFNPDGPGFIGRVVVEADDPELGACCEGGACFWGCEETVDACGCTGIPTTLTATVQAQTDPSLCNCLDIITIPLTHSAGTWSGTASLGSCGGRTVTLEMFCDMGDWFMRWTFSDACLPTQVVSRDSGATYSCSPFHAEFQRTPDGTAGENSTNCGCNTNTPIRAVVTV